MNNYMRDIEAVSQFVEDLPLDFKQRISVYLYKDMVDEVKFLIGKK